MRQLLGHQPTRMAAAIEALVRTGDQLPHLLAASGQLHGGQATHCRVRHAHALGLHTDQIRRKIKLPHIVQQGCLCQAGPLHGVQPRFSRQRERQRRDHDGVVEQADRAVALHRHQ